MHIVNLIINGRVGAPLSKIAAHMDIDTQLCMNGTIFRCYHILENVFDRISVSRFRWKCYQEGHLKENASERQIQIFSYDGIYLTINQIDNNILIQYESESNANKDILEYTL